MSEKKKEPLNFGKRLAHTDKVVRDRTFRVLQKWLEKHPDLEHIEYMKLWKSLHFCMWMSDKRAVQQELAVNIALLVNSVPEERQVNWFEAFWVSMQNHWEQLDVHRINKYTQLIRFMVAESLKLLRVAGWPLESLERLNTVYTTKGPLVNSETSGVPRTGAAGVRLHFIGVFIEELEAEIERDKGNTLTPEVMLRLFEPFVALAAFTRGDRGLVERLHERVLRRAPLSGLGRLVERLLEVAASKEVSKENRKTLYETIEVLERRRPAAQEVASLGLTTPKSAASSSSSQALGEEGGEGRNKKKKKKKRKAQEEAAEEPENESSSGVPDSQQVGTVKKKKKKSMSVGGSERSDRPMKKKGKKRRSGGAAV